MSGGHCDHHGITISFDNDKDFYDDNVGISTLFVTMETPLLPRKHYNCYALCIVITLWCWIILGFQSPLLQCAPLTKKDLTDLLSGSHSSHSSSASSSGLHGGRVRHFPTRSSGLSGGLSGGLSRGLDSGGSAITTTTLGGGSSLFGSSASDSPMMRSGFTSSLRPRGSLPTSGLSSSLSRTSGLSSGGAKIGGMRSLDGRTSKLGSTSLDGGVEASDDIFGSASSHPHRHGHSGHRGSSRNNRATSSSSSTLGSGSSRVVRMECREVPSQNLRSLLGPAFNARYMAVETPSDFRPPSSLGAGLRGLPSRRSPSSLSSFAGKSPLGSRLLGDAPGEDDNKAEQDGDLLTWGSETRQVAKSALDSPAVVFVEHALSDGAPAPGDEDVGATIDGNMPPGAVLYSLGEIRGSPVLSARLETPTVLSARKKVKNKGKFDMAGDGSLQGDQTEPEAIILVGVDAIAGQPEFSVAKDFRRDLPGETRQNHLVGIGKAADLSSGLPLLLRAALNSTKASSLLLNKTFNETLSVDDAQQPEVSEDHLRRKRSVAGLMNGKVSRSISSSSSTDKFGSGGAGAAEPWKCASEVVWEDLGEDYYPRYIRRTRCLQRGCYNSFYACRERSFTIKVLRRRSDRCVPVYGVTVNAGAAGVPTVQKNKLLRYEQEWIFEERALPFCCECAPRFI